MQLIMLSVEYLVLLSDVCFKIDQRPSPHLVSELIKIYLTRKLTYFIENILSVLSIFIYFIYFFNRDC